MLKPSRPNSVSRSCSLHRLGKPEELASMVIELITNSYMNAEVVTSTVASGCHRSSAPSAGTKRPACATIEAWIATPLGRRCRPVSTVSANRSPAPGSTNTSPAASRAANGRPRR